MSHQNTQQYPTERSNQLISLLQSAADYELLTHQIYANLSEYPSVRQIPKLMGLFNTASFEDREHYDQLLTCIERLQSREPHCDLRNNNNASGRRYNLHQLLGMLRRAEEFSVKTYTEICSITLEYDYRVFDLSYRNLYENITHQRLVMRILKTEFSQEETDALAQPVDVKYCRENSAVKIAP